MKALRERLGISQEELGRRAKISFRTIAELENNRQIPKLDTAIALAGVLEISLESLARSMGMDVSPISNSKEKTPDAAGNG